MANFNGIGRRSVLNIKHPAAVLNRLASSNKKLYSEVSEYLKYGDRANLLLFRLGVLAKGEHSPWLMFYADLDPLIKANPKVTNDENLDALNEVGERLVKLFKVSSSYKYYWQNSITGLGYHVQPLFKDYPDLAKIENKNSRDDLLYLIDMGILASGKEHWATESFYEKEINPILKYNKYLRRCQNREVMEFMIECFTKFHKTALKEKQLGLSHTMLLELTAQVKGLGLRSNLEALKYIAPLHETLLCALFTTQDVYLFGIIPLLKQNPDLYKIDNWAGLRKYGGYFEYLEHEMWNQSGWNLSEKIEDKMIRTAEMFMKGIGPLLKGNKEMSKPENFDEFTAAADQVKKWIIEIRKYGRQSDCGNFEWIEALLLNHPDLYRAKNIKNFTLLGDFLLDIGMHDLNAGKDHFNSFIVPMIRNHSPLEEHESVEHIISLINFILKLSYTLKNGKGANRKYVLEYAVGPLIEKFSRIGKENADTLKSVISMIFEIDGKLKDGQKFLKNVIYPLIKRNPFGIITDRPQSFEKLLRLFIAANDSGIDPEALFETAVKCLYATPAGQKAISEQDRFDEVIQGLKELVKKNIIPTPFIALKLVKGEVSFREITERYDALCANKEKQLLDRLDQELCWSIPYLGAPELNDSMNNIEYYTEVHKSLQWHINSRSYRNISDTKECEDRDRVIGRILTTLSMNQSYKMFGFAIRHPKIPRDTLLNIAMDRPNPVSTAKKENNSYMKALPNYFHGASREAFAILVKDGITSKELTLLATSGDAEVRRKISVIKTADLIAKELGLKENTADVRVFVNRIDDEGGEVALKLLDELIKLGVVRKYGMGGINSLRKISGTNTEQLLQALKVLANRGMLASLQIVPSSFTEQKKTVKGSFNESDPIHLLLNYFEIIDIMSTSSGKAPDFEEYLSMIQTGITGDTIRTGVPKEVRLELKGVVYEAYLIRKKILEIQSRANELGRSVMVVANRSYGDVAISPILENGLSGPVIAGTTIPVISAKVGSTECHNNELVLNPKLFFDLTMEKIIKENPFVIVIDASTSVSDPSRTSPHIPDAFKGYRNYFMAVNKIVSGQIHPANFGEDNDFGSKLIKESHFSKFISKGQKVQINSEKSAPYSMNFWYPGNKQLYLRVNKKKDTEALKMGSAAEINDPALIFMQSALEPEALPKNIRDGFMRGKTHHAAYFDDRDNFRQFYLSYRKGYGIVPDKKIANLSRFYFNELNSFLGEKIQRTEVKPQNVTRIKNIVTDLDGTIAMTDEPIPDTILSSLIDFLRTGGKLFIATEDIEQNLDKRITLPIPLDLRKNLIVFSDGATKAFTYDNEGNKVHLNDYNGNSLIDRSVRMNICDILKKDFAEQFEFDNRENRISPDYRIDLHNVKKPRNDFIAKLSSLMMKAGIKAKAYKVGRTSVKIVLQHKENAIKYLVQKGLIEPMATVVLGDSARQNQIDRGMLTALPEAISINIGTRSRTIEKENPNAFQYADGGLNATLNILDSINKYGGLDKELLPR